MNLVTLSIQQVSRKEQLEAEIQTGLASFVKVGNALIEINESKLYLDEYGTFEEYCKGKWGFSRRYGYQLMESAAVATECEPIVHIEKESVAREISKAPKRKRKAVAKQIKKTVEKKKAKNQKPVVTAKEAREIVSKIQSKPRGGIAAEKQKAEAKTLPDDSVLSKRLFQNDESEEETPHAIISKWWEENKRRLCEYPAASPTVVVEKILGLFA